MYNINVCVHYVSLTTIQSHSTCTMFEIIIRVSSSTKDKRISWIITLLSTLKHTHTQDDIYVDTHTDNIRLNYSFDHQNHIVFRRLMATSKSDEVQR